LAERLTGNVPEPLTVSLSRNDRECVAHLNGELDVSTSEELRSELLALIDDGCRSLVIDMSDLALIDSTGLGVLVGVLKRILQHGGEMILKSPRRTARKVFEITGLDRVFTIVD